MISDLLQEAHGLMKPVTGREIAALLNPRLALLVSFCGEDGRPSAVTVAWQTPLSHEPPLVGISLRAGSFSQGSIQATGEFVINIVGPDFMDAVTVCGNTSGARVDKLAQAGLAVGAVGVVNSPLIAGALGYLVCRVIDSIPLGDHVFIVAQVLQAQVQAQAFGNAWDSTAGVGLLCLQRDRFGRYIDIKENE
jgi:flavin reductase (DIM6/NTAB) family NADH-FMN oxidoreductase RutF